MTKRLLPVGAALLLGALGAPALAQDSGQATPPQPEAAHNSVEARFLALEQRLAALEAENARLKAEIAPRYVGDAPAGAAQPVVVASAEHTGNRSTADSHSQETKGTVGYNNSYAFHMLDNAEAANTKPLV